MASGKNVFQCPWFSIEAVTQNGEDAAPYYRINQPNGVICIAVSANGSFVMVRQYRPAIEKWTLEIPAGFIDEGETPLEAITRELYEETGYVFSQYQQLFSGRLFLNRYTSTEYVFLATGGRKDPDFSPKEKIEATEVTPAGLRQMIVDDQFEQIAALSAFSLAEIKLGRTLL